LPNVYCVTRYRNDISAAEKWGKTIEIIDGPISPFATDRIAWNISPPLADFKQEDYFLLTGPVSGYVIGSLLLFERFDWINVLRFDPYTNDYSHEVVKKIANPVKKQSKYPPGRIFVVNFIGHSILAAMDFANPDIPKDDRTILLTTGDIVQSDIENLTNRIAEKMSDFQKGDMVLLSGAAILNPILAAVVSSYQQDISLLLFNPKRNEYHKREIILPHLRMTAQLAMKEAVA